MSQSQMIATDRAFVYQGAKNTSEHAKTFRASASTPGISAEDRAFCLRMAASLEEKATKQFAYLRRMPR